DAALSYSGLTQEDSWARGRRSGSKVVCASTAPNFNTPSSEELAGPPPQAAVRPRVSTAEAMPIFFMGTSLFSLCERAHVVWSTIKLKLMLISVLFEKQEVHDRSTWIVAAPQRVDLQSKAQQGLGLLQAQGPMTRCLALRRKE